jgi:beta-1,4-N-acetylglucosaminyltransferase
VGTTRFDLLIEIVTQQSAFEWMKANGYSAITIQYGKGDKPTIPADCPITVNQYDFRPSLEADMKAADLIISHAGAGTVMESLRLKKRLVVVVNTLLMNNHQTELAHAMAKRSHLFVVDQPHDLRNMELWNDFDSFVPIPHEGGDDFDFPRLLNCHMGIL